MQYASSLAAELRKVGQMRKKETVAASSPHTPQQSSSSLQTSAPNVIDLDLVPDPRSPPSSSRSSNSNAVINLIPQVSQSTIHVDQTAVVIGEPCDRTALNTISSDKTNVRHSGDVPNSVQSNNSTAALQAVHKPSTLPALPLPQVDPDSDSDMDLERSPTR